ALGGALAQFGLLAPFIGAAVITTFSLIATLLFLDESLPADKRVPATTRATLPWRSWSGHLRNQTVVLLLSLTFIVNFTIAGLSAVFPLFAKAVVFTQLPEQAVARNVGFMMAYIGLSAVLSQLLLNRPMVNRFGEHNVMLISISMAFFSTLGLSTLVNPWLLLILLTPAGIAYAIGIPSGEALLVRTATDHTRGQLIGLYNAMASLAYVLGPIIAGYLFDTFTPRSPFIFSMGLVILGLGLAFLLKSRTIQNKRLQERRQRDRDRERETETEVG
ncbi:MAG TPA: MFS transporter, partial [Anaerolineae bacterium]|nr:MFS transporter [Anaerolineae bacterium]